MSDTSIMVKNSFQNWSNNMEKNGCPCLHTKPCGDSCTCANPVMSMGCRRCAKYGSKEQKKQAAEQLANIIDTGTVFTDMELKYILDILLKDYDNIGIYSDYEAESINSKYFIIRDKLNKLRGIN